LLTINYSFFIQLAIFIALVLFLQKFLFAPVYDQIWDERDQLITGNKQKAEELSEKVDRLIVYHEAQVWASRKLAEEESERTHRQAVKDQEQTIANIRTESNEMIAELRERIAAEFKAAQERIRADAEKMGKTIAQKILGTGVSE